MGCFVYSWIDSLKLSAQYLLNSQEFDQLLLLIEETTRANDPKVAMYFSRISKEISDITRKGCRVREQTRNEAREIAEKHIIQSLMSQNEG